ncbi:YqzL family protein [Tepidibacillus fermentans]|uniref:YqzL-like protein n=1 Tax=Tepidibacillus fermentans TaxID=1281767 RepID=A0A4R3KJM4_9BACI|nr:YqzL family protein [Tepidibacillus fermentans]TCS83722.1 YqzL-like protein [Tepidibacillus fermentans]
MKDFSWNYFCKTGQIDAYLLYKECQIQQDVIQTVAEVEEEQDQQ